ncbi:hypothetical protein [Hymenobacter tibetensis]|nr:hypothetical protein [Hymenobacter tibetensis]
MELFYDHVANQLQHELRILTTTNDLEDYAAYIKLPDLDLDLE